MKYKINVNEEDINNGIPGDCRGCAISQALRRKFKTDKTTVDIDVNGDVSIWVKNKEYEVYHKHESVVEDFIYDFDLLSHNPYDEYIQPNPITFEMIERTE